MTWGKSAGDFGKFILAAAVVLGCFRDARAQRLQEEFHEPAPSQPRVFNGDAQLREKIKKLRDLEGHTQKITGFAFCSDAKCALSCSEDCTLRCWELETGNEVWKAISFPGVQLQSVAVRADDKEGVVAGNDEKLYVIDIDQGQIKKTLEGSSKGLREVAISPDGKFAAAVDGDGVGYAWESETGVRTKLLSNGKTKLTHLQFHPDGKTLWASGDFASIANYQLSRLNGISFAAGGNVSPNRRFAFSVDGQYLLMASRNSFSVAARRGAGSSYGREDRPEHASSLPRIEQVAGIGQDYFALSAGDGSIEIWRGRDDQPAGQFPAEVGGVTAVAIGGDKFLLTGRADGKLSLWSTNCLRHRAEDMRTASADLLGRAFDKKDFDQLEKLEPAYYKPGACFQTGQSALYVYHSALGKGGTHTWDSYRKILSEWIAAKPKSIGPRGLLAYSYVEEGWEARGAGVAATVAPEGWRVLEEKLKDALKCVEDAEKLYERDPQLSLIEMIACRGLSDRDRANDAFRKGVRINPAYFPLYTEGANQRLPRWGGEEGELAAWLDSVCDEVPSMGDEIYARTALELVNANSTENYFDETRLDWRRIKRGVKTLLTRYDDSSVLANPAALLAMFKLDQEIAALAFPILGLERTKDYWKPAQKVANWKNLARIVPTGQEEKVTWAAPDGIDQIALSVDGKRLALASNLGHGSLQIWDTDAWEKECGGWKTDLKALSIAYSPIEYKIATAGATFEVVSGSPSFSPELQKAIDAARLRAAEAAKNRAKSTVPPGQGGRKTDSSNPNKKDPADEKKESRNNATSPTRFAYGVGRTDLFKTVAEQVEKEKPASGDTKPNAGPRLPASEQKGATKGSTIPLTVPGTVAARSPNRVNTLLLWEPYEDGRVKQTSIGAFAIAQACAFSPDGKTLAVGGQDRNVTLLGSSGGNPGLLPIGSEITGVQFDSSGTTVAIATAQRGLQLCDITQKRPEPVPDALPQYVLSKGKAFAFSHNGKWLAYLNVENAISILERESKTATVTLPKPEGDTLVVVFSPDDKLLATAGDDLKIHLWNATTGKELHVFEGSFNPISNLCFLPDGKKMISATCEGILRLWDISSYAQ